tara:strand:- start:16499 stop:17302 length:804 start_codon:yes stop_codon:yes gene_type:complete
MKNHPSIAHVSQGDIFQLDGNQFPEYPLGNVLITQANFGTNVTEYNVQLIVADKAKVLENESKGETNEQSVPFYGTDDVVDIHANTLSVLNDLTSYTQRGTEGFEINGDIQCEPFVDRFNNGLAGWSATFELTVHNDRNRCLFFLINPSGSGYIIEDCETQEEYLAVLSENTSGSIGQVFSTVLAPNPSPRYYLETYDYLRCFKIKDTFEDRDDYDFVNLPIVALPYEDYVTCDNCELWTSPKIWDGTPEKWDNGAVDEALRKWQFT